MQTSLACVRRMPCASRIGIFDDVTIGARNAMLQLVRTQAECLCHIRENEDGNGLYL
jgi:hypothetical protein